jgi:hypothetical protein
MTTVEFHQKKPSTFELLESKYGLLMSLKDVAEVLKYPSVDSVRKALSRKTLALPTTRLPNRREIFIRTNELAGYLDKSS